MTYTYTLDGADVTPRGDWEINYEQNVGQIFFRRVLTGDLTFIGDDYALIMASSDCDVLEFKIYCGVTEHWEGQFKFPYDFDIDEDSCACVGTPEVVDEYSCIMNNYETEYTFGPSTAALNIDLRNCAGGLLNAMGIVFRFLTNSGVETDSYLSFILNFSTKMNCGLTISSSFLFRDNFPNGTAYAGAYGANNYITGAANRLEYIYLAENSIILGWLGGTACSSPRHITFKMCEDLMRNAFNAYWYIDQNGHFRVEHIHFFDPDFPESDFEVDIDLTTLVSNNGKTFAYRRNKYTYETGELYDQEKWTWQHYEGTEGTIAHGQDFAGVPVFYGALVDQKSDCVPGVFKEKDIATPQFWSDIDWAFQLIAAGTLSTITCPDGFCFFDIDTATNWIRCETGVLSAGNVINGHLSTANLQDHYHTWNRIFLTGDMNSGDVTTFDSAQRTKLQEAIEFDWCCGDEFDPKDLIRTELGLGTIKTVIQKKRNIEVELLY